MEDLMDVMIDIESLSLKPNALVLSIGVVPFSVADSAVYEGRYFQLNIREQQVLGRHVDVDTIAWWINQAETNPKAAEVFRTKGSSLVPAMYEFGQYVAQETHEGGRIWALGPQFDIVVLESLLEDCGVSKPWDYKQINDMRTIRSFVKRLGVEHEIRCPENMAMHDAHADATHQARWLVQALKYLGVET
jgi:hypothetical protein